MPSRAAEAGLDASSSKEVETAGKSPVLDDSKAGEEVEVQRCFVFYEGRKESDSTRQRESYQEPWGSARGSERSRGREILCRKEEVGLISVVLRLSPSLQRRARLPPKLTHHRLRRPRPHLQLRLPSCRSSPLLHSSCLCILPPPRPPWSGQPPSRSKR